MKKALMATGIAAISACSQPLADDQRERVEEMVHEAEVFLPAVQHLARAADPLVDAEGNPVDDNEMLADDIAETVVDVRDIFEQDQIRTWHEESGAQGRHLWDATPHTLEGQFILLNTNNELYWSCGLLVHEAGHRFQRHTSAMSTEAHTNRSAEDGGETFAEVIVEERDYPFTVELLFGAVSFSVADTQSAWEKLLEQLDARYESGELTSEEYESQLDELYAGMTEKTREEWGAERAEVYYRDIRVLDVFGVPESALVEALQFDGIYELVQERISESYSEARREAREASEARSAEKRESGRSSKLRR